MLILIEGYTGFEWETDEAPYKNTFLYFKVKVVFQVSFSQSAVPVDFPERHAVVMQSVVRTRNCIMYVLPPVFALLRFESRKYAIDSFVLGQGKEQFYLVYLFVIFSTVKNY